MEIYDLLQLLGGKTTLVDSFVEKEVDPICVDEATDEWEEVNGCFDRLFTYPNGKIKLENSDGIALEDDMENPFYIDQDDVRFIREELIKQLTEKMVCKLDFHDEEEKARFAQELYKLIDYYE